MSLMIGAVVIVIIVAGAAFFMSGKSGAKNTAQSETQEKKGSEGKNASGRRGHQYLPGRGMAGKAVRVEVTRRCPNHYGIPGQTLRDGAWKGGAGPWLILLVSTAQTALPDAISRRLVLHGRSFRRR